MRNLNFTNRYALLVMVPVLTFGLVSCNEDANTIVDSGNADSVVSSSIAVESSPVVVPSPTHIVETSGVSEPAEPVEDNVSAVSGFNFSDYREVSSVDCTLDGSRVPNAVMDIGFGDREYYGFTNEHSQLVHVYADEIILQDDSSEPVNGDGRYCSSIAKVPGVESPDHDRGHVIADSLGGTSSAFNITPQDSTLNRHGDQAYMERNIRSAGGATNFRAYISYPNTSTQVPSHYDFYYVINGQEIHTSFANGNPDAINEELGIYDNPPINNNSTTENGAGDISTIDTNGNGKVSISEAKNAGFTMPITKDHWLYAYMTDGNNNGMVGE